MERRQKNANSVRNFRERKRDQEKEMRRQYAQNEKRIAELERQAADLTAELLKERPKPKPSISKAPSRSKPKDDSGKGNAAFHMDAASDDRPSWFGDPF